MTKKLSYEEHSQKLSQSTTRSVDSPESITVESLQLITKQMSQLIAKSWLPEGADIREVLLSGDTEKMLQLFRDNEIPIDVFGVNQIEVDWSTFFGSLEDTTNPASPLKLVLAYPPKPDPFNLSDENIKAWVDNEDDSVKVPPHPYIPVTY